MFLWLDFSSLVWRALYNDSPLSMIPLQIKSGKSEKEVQQLLLKSVQYLERYMYLILFNSYLHLEKKNSWQRSFTTWMQQVGGPPIHSHSTTHSRITWPYTGLEQKRLDQTGLEQNISSLGWPPIHTAEQQKHSPYSKF